MAITLDSAINFLVPTILILGVIGFVYLKIIKPLIIPLITDAINAANGKTEGGGEPTIAASQVTYETI